MKSPLGSVPVFADESGARLRRLQILARFCAAGIVVVGVIVVACLASGVSLRGPDLPGFDSNASGDDHRSVTPGTAASPGPDSRSPSREGDAGQGSATSTSAETPAPEPTPSSAAAPTPAATANGKALDAPRADPSHIPGTPPTAAPGKPD